MRIRDENKVEAIYDATIQLVNEIGFAEASISKIAKKQMYRQRQFTFIMKIRRTYCLKLT